MKTVLIACLLVLAAPAFAQTKSRKAPPKETPLIKGVRALDAKNGFRGYKFGMPIESISGLKRVETSLFDGAVYERSNEHKGVGPVQLTSLWFVSVKGRLSAIIMHCYGSVNAGNLLAALQLQYGPGLEYSDAHTSWPGKRVTMDYKLSGSTNEECSVIILSNAAAKQQAGLADDATISKSGKDL